MSEDGDEYSSFQYRRMTYKGWEECVPKCRALKDKNLNLEIFIKLLFLGERSGSGSGEYEQRLGLGD